MTLTRIFFLLVTFSVYGEKMRNNRPGEAPTQGLKAEGLLIVLDRSSSMEPFFSQVQMHVRDLVSRTPKDEPTGLIHFNGCGTEKVVHRPVFGPNNQQAINREVNGLAAEGQTALGLALRLANSEMRRTNTCPQLVLFTDGEDTCGGDPLSELRPSVEMCQGINFNVITTTSDEAILELYEKLVQMTRHRGKVTQVNTIEEGADAVMEIIGTMRANRQKAYSSLKKKNSRAIGTPTENEEAKVRDPKKRKKAKANTAQGQSQSRSNRKDN